MVLTLFEEAHEPGTVNVYIPIFEVREQAEVNAFSRMRLKASCL